MKRLQGEERIAIAAPPERVWALIADMTRMGEWSPECRRCEWLDGAAGPVAGARFRGHNRVWFYRWARDCVVTSAVAGKELAFVTIGTRGDEQTGWRYRLEPAGDGTELVESFENKALERWLRPFLGTHTGRAIRGRQVRRGMRTTLRRIKEASERA